MAELEELEQEELDQNLLTIDTSVDTLPSVPSTSLPSKPGLNLLLDQVLESGLNQV